MVRLIVAGNFHQAEEFAERMGWVPREWSYVDHPDRIRGLKDTDLYFVGTYWDRSVLLFDAAFDGYCKQHNITIHEKGE